MGNEPEGRVRRSWPSKRDAPQTIQGIRSIGEVGAGRTGDFSGSGSGARPCSVISCSPYGFTLEVLHRHVGSYAGENGRGASGYVYLTDYGRAWLARVARGGATSRAASLRNPHGAYLATWPVFAPERVRVW